MSSPPPHPPSDGHAAGVIESLNLRDPAAVEQALLAGADANHAAPCRVGSIDRIACESESGTHLLATGDLHDHPLHLMRLLRAFDAGPGTPGAGNGPVHLTLHELIHSDRLVNGLDFSYRMLTRAAALKSAFPDRVHTLLANHELAQATGHPVAKDGVRCNQAFDEAIEATFAAAAPRIKQAIAAFIRSMPIALRCTAAGGDVLCAHSLPAPERMDQFDFSVFDRPLQDEDYAPRTGSAHLLVWGRGHTPRQLADLASRLAVGTFILGHEKAETGVTLVAGNTVVLNSDHEQGVYWPIDLTQPVQACDALNRCIRLTT